MTHIPNGFSKELKSICEPFFKQSPISYFAYVRRYKQHNSYACLCSNQALLEHWIEACYPIAGSFLNSEYNLWNLRYDERLIRSVGEHGLHHGFTIRKEHQDYVECYDFATSENNDSIMDFYFNKKEYLSIYSLLQRSWK